MEEATNREPNNTGMRSIYVPCAENNLGKSEDFKPSDAKLWIVSDTHFCHRRILIYESANRPFKDRNEAMIQRWNEKVRENDLVLHLGDFSFGNKSRIKNIVARLNGRIWLLMGNHDREQHYDWQELGFNRTFKHPFLLDGKFVFSHEPLDVIPDGLINIYGHVHGSKYFNTIDPNRLCACVERWNCAPIEYDFIKQTFNV